MHHVFERIASAGVLPIFAIEDVDDAIPVAEALVAGGLAVAEVVLRTSAAERAIAAMATVPGLLVGAGTVVAPEQVERVLDLGASFALAPHFAPAAADRAVRAGLPYVPGVLTPTEMAHALDAGFPVQKFFPAAPAGGVAFLKAVSAPLPGIRFLPTGGIGPEVLAEYARLPCVLAAGAGWIVPPRLLAERDWDGITRLAASAVETVRAAREGVAGRP